MGRGCQRWEEVDRGGGGRGRRHIRRCGMGQRTKQGLQFADFISVHMERLKIKNEISFA